jgi:hypothetical protein
MTVREDGLDCNREREFFSLDSLYPECRSKCLPNMTKDELLATANPDGGQCLPCPENDAGEPTRGCQCVPLEDIRTRKCVIDRWQRENGAQDGCMDFVKTRVCDDGLQPALVIGIVMTVSGLMMKTIMVMCVWVTGCSSHPIHPSVGTTLATLCETLSSRSQTGTVWKYVQILEDEPKLRCIVINSAAKEHTVGHANPVVVPFAVTTVAEPLLPGTPLGP